MVLGPCCGERTRTERMRVAQLYEQLHALHTPNRAEVVRAGRTLTSAAHGRTFKLRAVESHVWEDTVCCACDGCFL
jgi:hypothetical protein